MVNSRVRTVEGSCWSCRKRRIKCDLSWPQCQRCLQVGATCDYNTRLIRWNTKPTSTTPAHFQLPVSVDEHISLTSHEERALGYFERRFWPLLTTSTSPCPPPILLALGNRGLLLAICLMADSHRVLQDGRNSHRVPQLKRLECLSTVRGELRKTCESNKPPDVELLFAVLLLYFQAGFLESDDLLATACTSSHHAGVRAIITRLGGIDTVLKTGPEPLHMLLSGFASTDLTTAMLAGGRPCFTPETWDQIDQRSVWWARDPLSQLSLGKVLRQMSSMAHYREDIQNGLRDFSMDRAREFQVTVTPTFAPLGFTLNESASSEAVHAYTLIRSFQHAALIYLYRAICGLHTTHALVQQHVLSCLECIFSLEQPSIVEPLSTVINCVVFPLLVAGAHVQSLPQRRGVVNAINMIQSRLKFASVQSVHSLLVNIWRLESDEITWHDMFSELNISIAIL